MGESPSRLSKSLAEQGPALRAGLALGVASVGPSLARGLLHRSAVDQALVTGVLAAVRLGVGSFGHAVSESSAEILVEATGTGTRARAQIIGAVTVAGISLGVMAQVKPNPEGSVTSQAVRAVAVEVGRGAAASALVTATDAVTAHRFHQRLDLAQVGFAAASGGIIAASRMIRRKRRARQLYSSQEQPRGVLAAPLADDVDTGPVQILKAAGAGLGATVGVLGLAAAELGIAHSVSVALHSTAQERGPLAPVVAHGTSMAALSGVALIAVDQLRRRVEHRSDVIEAAYRQPPTNPHVSAGPRSEVEFGHIGKEGRRFVVMALDGAEIANVMAEDAKDPVRVVAGYRSARSVGDRAALALRELHQLGGFQRSVIMVGAPTGIGYLNYVATEALEYLARGDCATVVPQYSHSPSALSLDRVADGIQLQTLVLRGIASHIATLPPISRPRVVQFGESLGAMVALDVAANAGTRQFEDLGLDGGLYLGVPFLSRSWQSWKDSPTRFDPGRRLRLTAAGTDPVRPYPPGHHLMVVHDDDPVNKFSFDILVRPPWWMGPPQTRPPGVPLETKYRTLTTFMITLIDLKNGMQSKPGSFERRGHDYRIDVRACMQEVFGFDATDDQIERIEAALREREQEWSISRLVANAFTQARNQTASKLRTWGVPVDDRFFQETADDLARGKRSVPSIS